MTSPASDDHFTKTVSRAWQSVFSAHATDESSNTESQALLADLITRYSEPHRAYHTREHVAECVVLAGRHMTRTKSCNNLLCALLFHDVVYDPHSHTNEAESAELARHAIAKLGAAGPDLSPDEVARLIMLTCHSAKTPDEAVDPDGALMVDIDLSILAAPEARYDRYDGDIRREYAFVPEADYRKGRAAVLRGFLERPHIYSTGEFQRRYEVQARGNIQRSLARLADESAPLL